MTTASQKGIAPVALVLIILVALAVVGGGVYVITQYKKPPTQVLKEAFEKTLKQTSASVNLDMRAKGKSTAEGRGVQDIDLGVAVDLEDVTFPPEGSDKTGDSEGTITLDGTIAGAAFKGSISFKYVPPEMYLKLNPGLQFPDMPFDPSFLSASWVFLDLEAEDGILAAAGPEIQQQIECRKNDRAKVQAYLKKLDFKRIMKEVAVGQAADLNGEKAVPYAITLDWEGLGTVGKELEALSTCSKPEGVGEEADGSGEGWRENIEEPRPVVWVGSASGLLRGVDVEIVPKKDFDGKLTITMRMSDFGKQVQIDVPQDAIPVEQFITSLLLGGMMTEGFGDSEGGGSPQPQLQY